LFPYINVLPSNTFSWTFAVSALFILTLGILLWKTKQRSWTNGSIVNVYSLCAAALCVFALATNAPNPGLTLERILDHAESRFALNAITGMSLCVGIIVN